ncbi:CEL-like protein [Mya arenaria]|uniref:Carboxylic ester hydrolase n=1 Tax=Mya arenaria TaxID=6604 RepID=A0ABY7G1C8_MYAAR|nr:CEL-like protein [Mya arenaria]
MHFKIILATFTTCMYCCLKCDVFATNETVKCKTKLGIFTGTLTECEFDFSKRFVMRFLKIPFAMPPVDNLRFRRPIPFGFNGNETYDATRFGPACMQPHYGADLFQQSEDCLHLNVFIPGRAINTQRKFAVMVYIHGGSFLIGSGITYSGDILSAFNDVIVVTLNYRLNIFGFLSSGTDNDGNLGLWDMRMAIKWIHDHIDSFGGDNERVTLFGNSAGGAAVMYQALYPPNRGLFQRVIAQSGSSLSGWALQRNSKELYEILQKQVPCTLDEILSCFQKVPASKLLKIHLEIEDAKVTFGPSVDNEFIPYNPAHLLVKKTHTSMKILEFFSELDFMTGITSMDGALDWAYSHPISNNNSIEDFEESIKKEIFYDFSIELSKDVLHEISTHYSMSKDISMETMINFTTDLVFLIPAHLSAKTHAMKMNKGYTFFYVFDETPSFAPYINFIDGASHAFELPYVFGFPKEMEQWYMLNYDTTNFSVVSKEEFEDPNIQPSGQSEADVPYWPQYRNSDEFYLNLQPGMTNSSVCQHVAGERTKLLEDLLFNDHKVQVSASSPIVNNTQTKYKIWTFGNI